MTIDQIHALRNRARISGGRWIGEPKLNQYRFWELAFKASKGEQPLLVYVRDRETRGEIDERDAILDIERAVGVARLSSR